MSAPSPLSPRQAVVTVAMDSHAERLDEAFASFAMNPFLDLHAFIIGDRLPTRRVEQVTYHLVAPDPTFSHPMRDLYYRRFLFIDEVDAAFVLLVDNTDVLCLQSLSELPRLLRGASLGACVEHAGSRYLEGQGYCSNYLNAGVTFWDLEASRRIREDIVRRGRARFRSVEDQLTLNEVVHTRYADELIILPCQYNYRAYLAPVRVRGWPTVSHLDGVKIYHNSRCVGAARQLGPVKPAAELPGLLTDAAPLNRSQRFWRRVRNRFTSHWVR